MLSYRSTQAGTRGVLTATLWFYAALGVALNLIGPALEAIRTDFGLGYTELAVALAAVGAGYAVGSIAGGMLSDRVGRRPAIVLATLLAGLSIGAAAASGGLSIFVVAWLIAGIGLGGADGAMTALISDVAGDRAGTLLNVAHLAFAAGALMAPALVGVMLSTGAGWRPAVWFAAVLMLTSLVPFVRLQFRRVSAAPVRLRETIGEMASPVPLLLGVGLALYVGVEIGFGGFFAAFLEAEFALARPLATTLVSAFWIGLFVGRGVGAWLAARWDLYRLVLTAPALTGADSGCSRSWRPGRSRPWSGRPPSEHPRAHCFPRSWRSAFVCGPASPERWPAA